VNVIDKVSRGTLLTLKEGVINTLLTVFTKEELALSGIVFTKDVIKPDPGVSKTPYVTSIERKLDFEGLNTDSAKREVLIDAINKVEADYERQCDVLIGEQLAKMTQDLKSLLERKSSSKH